MDGTVVRAHQHAAGTRAGTQENEALGPTPQRLHYEVLRSKPGTTTLTRTPPGPTWLASLLLCVVMATLAAA